MATAPSSSSKKAAAGSKPKAAPAPKAAASNHRTADNRTLALVLQRLAEEGHARKDSEFWTLTAKEAADVAARDGEKPPEELDEAAAHAKVAALYEKKENDLQAELDALFQDTAAATKMLNEQLQAAVAACRTAYKQRDDLMMEKLKLEEGIESVEADCKDKADLCRNLQSKTKEYEEVSKRVLEDEVRKTEEMRASFTDSIQNIVTSIEAEEAALTAAQDDNAKLAVKIAEFEGHLAARREHLDAQDKARAIEKQLLEAKLQQHKHAEQQRHLTSDQYAHHLAQLQQTELGLQLQYEAMRAKLNDSSYRDTAAPVFKQCEEQLAKMVAAAEDDEREAERLTMAREDKEQKAEKIRRCIAAARRRTEEIKAERAPLEEQCRTLSARRAEQTKARLAAAPPLMPRPPVGGHIHGGSGDDDDRDGGSGGDGNFGTGGQDGGARHDGAAAAEAGVLLREPSPTSAPSSSSGSPLRNLSRHSNSSSPSPAPSSSSSSSSSSSRILTAAAGELLPGEDTPVSSPHDTPVVGTGKRWT